MNAKEDQEAVEPAVEVERTLGLIKTIAQEGETISKGSSASGWALLILCLE